MLRNGLPLEATRLVTPRAVRGYAEGLGWQRIHEINGGIAVYRNPRESLRQLIVPLDEEFDDYPERVAEAVQRLAEFEGRPAREVLDHLLLPPADVIRIRERSPDAEEGNLPLDHAVRLIDGLRKALLATAHSVLVPQAYHPRLSRGEAEQFLSRCRLGQTERGSFVLMVACPLDVTAGLFEPQIGPFARRVTSLLMQSLRDLSHAADTGDVHALAEPSKYPGMSANLCESLLMLRPRGDRAFLSVSADWSRAYLPPTREVKQEIRLPQEAFEVAESLAVTLRSKPEPKVDRFVGFVDELRGQPTPDDQRPSGEVRFTLFVQEEEIHSKANLNTDDYAEAARAHLASGLITFKGILHRLPRLHRIDDVTEFKPVHFENKSASSDEAVPF